MTTYRYCLFNRPLGIGAQPKGVVTTEPRPAEGEDWYDIARHGFVIYDRKLTPDEEKAFELPPILGQDDLEKSPTHVPRLRPRLAGRFPRTGLSLPDGG